MPSSLNSFSDASLTMDGLSPPSDASSRWKRRTSSSTPRKLRERPSPATKLDAVVILALCSIVATVVAASYAIHRILTPAEMIQQVEAHDDEPQQSLTVTKTDLEKPIRNIELVTAPKPVASERVVPDSAPAKMPPVIAVQDGDKPAPRHGRQTERDVCAKHGMRKQVTNGGKGWRCRK
jgi:hypothetical protein